MKNLSIISYVLMIVGAGLTIASGISVVMSVSSLSYYARFYQAVAGLNQLTTFALMLVPGLVVLYLGQRFGRDPEAETRSALVVAAVSLISLFAVANSAVILYAGLFFSGPTISFVGGITGALFNRVDLSVR